MGTIIEVGSECFGRTEESVSCPVYEIKEGFPEEMVLELSAIGTGN